MKFHELESLVNDGAYDIVNWAADGEFAQVAYNVVPEPGGGFTIYSPTGREGYFQVTDRNFEPIVFATEDEVCDYIWAAVQESRRPKPPAPVRTPEQIADRQRRIAENRARYDGTA